MDRYNRDYVSPGGKQRYKKPNGEITEMPKRFRHRLGTDGIGRDLASGLIHGTRISLMVGIVAMGIAGFIGIILGALAGFFGDTKLKMPRIKYYFSLIGVFLGLFYGFGLRKYAISNGFSESVPSGIYELFFCHTPDHAVIDQAVELCKSIGRKHDKGFVNAVLRKASKM